MKELPGFPMAKRNIVLRLLGGIWRALNALRRVLHLILLLAIFGVLLAGVSGPPVQVPDSAALLDIFAQVHR